MNSAGIFLAAAVAILAIGYVAQPFLSRWRGRRIALGASERAELEEARRRAVRALVDLEYEHDAGRLTEWDYAAQRTQYTEEALVSLKALDDRESALDAAIEAEVAALRGNQRGPKRRGEPTPRAAPRVPRAVAERPRRGDTPPAAPAAPASRGRRRQLIWGLAAAALVVVAGVGVLTWRGLSDRATVATLGQIPSSQVNALLVNPAGTRTLYAGYVGGLYRSQDNGRSWQLLSLRGDVRGLAMNLRQPNTIWASGRGTNNQGLLARSDDRGETWRDLSANLPGADVRGLAVSPTDPQTLYAVVGGGVFWSTNGGEKWNRYGDRPPPGTGTALAVIAGPGQGRAEVVYLATSDRGMLVSDDGGTTWTTISGAGNAALDRQVSAVAAVGGQANAVYAGTRTGLYRRLPDANGWLRRNLEKPIAALGVLPTNADSVWAVDTEGNVYRSQDGGITWPGGAG